MAPATMGKRQAEQDLDDEAASNTQADLDDEWLTSPGLDTASQHIKPDP